MPITEHPLHGSGRADFPHPALASGDGAKPPQGIGMTHASRRRLAVHEPPHPVPRYAAVVIRDFLRISNKAQRAPTVRPGFVDVSRECAQTSLALIAKNAQFFGRIRRRRRSEEPLYVRRKSWIRQVVISRTLSVCGEVAERLKAAVC